MKRTNGKPFFDTNILIYTLAEGDPRSETARSLLAAGGVVSVNVSNEFVAVARNKYKLSWSEVREALADFHLLVGEPRPVTFGTHRIGLEIAERYQYRIFEALVIAAALEASCSVIYSEDMQSGQKIRGLTIRNPFPS
jgi:predicted nucleic acid-binding protein